MKDICKICGKKDTDILFGILDPHHLIPEWFKIDTKLIILCRECHAQLHGFYHKEAMKIVFKLDKEFFYKCFKKFKNGKRNSQKNR